MEIYTIKKEYVLFKKLKKEYRRAINGTNIVFIDFEGLMVRPDNYYNPIETNYYCIRDNNLAIVRWRVGYKQFDKEIRFDRDYSNEESLKLELKYQRLIKLKKLKNNIK